MANKPTLKKVEGIPTSVDKKFIDDFKARTISELTHNGNMMKPDVVEALLHTREEVRNLVINIEKQLAERGDGCLDELTQKQIQVMTEKLTGLER